MARIQMVAALQIDYNSDLIDDPYFFTIESREIESKTQDKLITFSP
jgi:hypothetical protein